MVRVKRGTIALKRRKNILARAKGFRFGRKSKERQAKTATIKAGAYSFAHRRDKKNVVRRNWQVNISYTLKEMGLSYSKFTGALKKKGIMLDRKVLADLAKNHPVIFKKIVEAVK